MSAPVDDVALAAAAAGEAGRVLLALRERGDLTGGPLGDAGDAAAQRAVVELLTRHRPDDVVFSEEAVDDRRRLTASRVWIVDPLDGTREYGDPPRSDWAVHVALWELGALTAAAVALPALAEVLTTAPPTVVPAFGPGPLRIAVSRSRPPAAAERVAAALDGTLVPMGSAGYKAMAVLRGEADAYVHAGGMYQWDSAAPVAVAAAAGLHTSRLDGAPLVYNAPDAWLPDLVVCRREHATAVLTALAGG